VLETAPYRGHEVGVSGQHFHGEVAIRRVDGAALVDDGAHPVQLVEQHGADERLVRQQVVAQVQVHDVTHSRIRRAALGAFNTKFEVIFQIVNCNETR